MKLYPIETGNLKLDGGAMFGVVPKSLWNRVYPADENNMVNLAMRALLVEEGDRKILIDNGLGEKLDKKFLSFYFLNGEDSLEGSLKKNGFSATDITDVIMTHLHFDHCGGGVKLENNKPVLTFPNAMYWTSEIQWETAMHPNAREKSSFFNENLLPIEESGHLNLISGDKKLTESIKLKLFHGHTAGQVIPFINNGTKTIVYVADLIPSAANIPVSWITAFDMEPYKVLVEKENFLNEAANNNYVLFFEHDINMECCTVKHTPKGVRLDRKLRLSELFN